MAVNMELLKPIAMEYLFENMVLAEDVYNYSGTVLLLSKGMVLTDTKIRQLKDFNANFRNILVFDNTYHTLMAHGLNSANTLAQEYLEEVTGYRQVKERTGELLSDIKTTGSIHGDDTESIASEMSEKLRTIDPSLIFQCINAPNPIDEYLRRHSVNVGFLNGLMARWMHLNEYETDKLVLAGLVHDVGKTKIPVQILDAPRKLTISEFEVMKMHPVYSYELLGVDSRFTEDIKLTARHHHEKMNGDGYPDGLNGDKISLFAKVTAVSDIYDAMVSKRSYKEANNPFSIIAKLSDQQFSELDMKLVNIFTGHMPNELVGRPVLLSDGSIGTIRYIVPNDLENPLVEINGEVKKTNKQLYCMRMILDE